MRRICLVLILLVVIPSSQDSCGSPANTSITYTLEPLWTETPVEEIVISDDCFFLQINQTDVILVENNSKVVEFCFNHSFYSIAAHHRTLFLPFDESVYAISFENYTHPVIISQISHETTGMLSSVISYGEYVYVNCYEWGFPIFDFSNPLHPRKCGYVPLDTWHSYCIYRVLNYGIFIGDHASGFFDLSIDPVHPLMLYEVESSMMYSGRIVGKPAVSDQYFAINFESVVLGERKRMIYIIPRETVTSTGSAFTFNYSIELEYEHLVLMNENILVVSAENNSISFFKITNSESLTYLDKIDLGRTGSVKDLHVYNDSNVIYISDGMNGLLEFSLMGITDSTTPAKISPGWNILLLLLSIAIMFPLKRYSKKS